MDSVLADADAANTADLWFLIGQAMSLSGIFLSVVNGIAWG